MAETIISPGVFQRENDISFINPAPVEVGAAILGPTVKGPVEIPTAVTSYNQYVRLFGDTFDNGSAKDEYLTSMAVKSYFSQGGDTVLITRIVSASNTWTNAANTHISSSKNASVQPFTLATLGKGKIYNAGTGSGDALNPKANYVNSDNSLVSGSKDNLRWEITNKNETKGTFTLSIRRGDDSHNNKVVLETFNNISLDPNSENYIEKVVGTQNQAISADATQVTTTGDYVNKSNFVRVSAVNSKTLNYLSTDGTTVQSSSAGVGFKDLLPKADSGSFYNANGLTAIASASLNLYQNISTATQGLVANDYNNVITLLGNKDDYKFNVISTPGLFKNNHSTQVDNVISLAESRGDCIAVVDLYPHGASVANVTGQADVLNSSYAASYWPWLQTQSGTGKNVFVPASVFIPGVYAFTDGAAAPWFAPAGLVRGGIVGVIQAERKLSRSQRDTLYDAKVNPIATFPGSGIAVFGQKTLQTKASALDRVNVRRLLIELKEFIGNQAQNLVFEQNTIATRNKFLAAVNPFLDSVVQRQGLFAFRVVMDDSNNTADVVDRNQLVGQIFIQPAKTAEFIVLDFTVEPTGATFGQ
jgi:phage tail sheath protein FI